MPVTLSIVILIAFSLSFYIKKILEVGCVILISDDEWNLIMQDGSKLNCSLSDRTYISNWLSLLVFTNEDQSALKYVILMRDAVSAELLSQLKLRLKVNTSKH